MELLDLLNRLAFHWRNGVVRLSEIEGTSIAYAIVVVHDNADVQQYRAHVDAHDLKSGWVSPAFKHFRKIAPKLSSAMKKQPPPTPVLAETNSDDELARSA